MTPTLLFFASNRSRWFLAILLLCLWLWADSTTARCDSVPSVVVLLVPGLRADDVERPELPTLARLIVEGGSGWMVCRAARVADSRLLRPDGRESEASLLTTLGSGSRALAPAALPESPAARILALRSANAPLDHSVPLGALGELFHQRGLKTATIGDNDSVWPDSEAWAVAMDAAGKIDFPMAHNNGLLADSGAPYGVRSDVTALLADFDSVRSRAGLIVLSFDDLDRADRYALYCRPEAAAAHRAAARRVLEILLSGIVARCQAPSGAGVVPILLLAPAPPASSEERVDRFAPIVWWGSGGNAGTLYSASTRRPGLVLNTDVLATFATRLNLNLPSGATGRPFHSDRLPTHFFSPPALPSAHYLSAQVHEWLRVVRLQNSPGGLPTVQLMLPLLGTVLLFLRRRASAENQSRLGKLVGAIAVLIVTLPLGMLVLPLWKPSAPWSADALLTALLLTVGGFALSRPRAVLTLFRLLCGLLVAALLFDLMLGTPRLQSAWMSYSVVEGARFYGIGNEYMGVAIGAACVLFALAGTREGRDPRPKNPVEGLKFVVLFLGLILGMGGSGAKVGAIPSAGAAFAVTLVVWKRGRLGLKEMGGILLLTAVGLGLLAAFDARHAAGDQTHFIRALTGAGGGSLPDILRRKLQLEGWLLLHSAWSPTLVVTAASLAWIRRSVPARFAAQRSRAALAGIAVGAVACLLCNDSGLTAAALVLLYGWAWAALEVTRPALSTPTEPAPSL